MIVPGYLRATQARATQARPDHQPPHKTGTVQPMKRVFAVIVIAGMVLTLAGGALLAIFSSL